MSDQFKPLQDYLLQFYPREHEASLVTSKTFPLTRSVVQRFRICDLAAELERAPQVGTLYIPAISPRAIEDNELMAMMVTGGSSDERAL